MAGARLLHDLSRVISFGYRDKQLGGGRKPRRSQDLVVDGVAHDHLRAVVARSIGKVAAFLDHGEPTSARLQFRADKAPDAAVAHQHDPGIGRCSSEEHTSALQSLMRISYAVF